MNLRLSLRTAVVVVLLLLTVTGAFAQVMKRHTDPLDAKVVSPIQFAATPSPEEWLQVRSQLPSATVADISKFHGSHGPDWRFWVDRRSGAMSLVEGRGIAWLPGDGNSLRTTGSGPGGKFTVADLSSKALSLIETYPSLFQISLSQLVLDEKGSVNFGEKNQYWRIAYKQHINRIPLEASQIVFHVSHGNLVQFGVSYAVPTVRNLILVAPKISAADARAALGTHIGGFLNGDRFLEEGSLHWAIRGAGATLGYSGPIGAGWQPQLVYRFRFQRPGSVNTWEALVSALDGSIVRFLDSNHYALVKGGVYKETNCTDPSNCVPGSAQEVGVPMPFVRMEFNGGACTGEDCYTTSAGSFSYPAGAVTATTSLQGKYFSVTDDCGPIAAAGVDGVNNGNVELGTTPANPSGLNTDCVAATQQSPPNSAPMTAGSGDTHAARNMYYHLSLINQKARFYLPTNDWIKGLDGTRGPVPVTTNITDLCNAFWDGTGVNFFKATRAPAVAMCNNTGEISAVALHEWGHGMDSNDANGAAPGELASGEAMGDWFAALEAQISCMGIGFRLEDPTNYWWDTSGYGSATNGSNSEACSGVRDMDYTRFCGHTDAPGCIATPRDPDAPHGAHAGLTPTVPHPTDPDGGTPARWNHMLSDAPLGVADGKSFFWSCPPSETYVGPLGHEGHCESAIASQSLWDFTKYHIRSYGGDIYNNDGTSDTFALSVAGWQYADRLWYLTRDLATSSYTAVQQGADFVTTGCSATVWFSTYRFIDDNDGNLANGTPHADLLFRAFDQHGIACGAASDASNQPSGLGAIPDAPVLSSCDATKSPVQLSWTASAGATEYRVLRNTLGCEFGFQPIAVLPPAQVFYEDAAVSPGSAYYYRVEPIGVNLSTFGKVSNCITAMPDVCPVQAIAAPTGLTATTPANEQILLTWNPVATALSYKVYRKRGSATSTQFPFEAIAVVTTPSFLDTTVRGSLTYTYHVVASSTACAACTGPASSDVEIMALGSCALPPSFGGVRSASATAGTCKITISWIPAVAECGNVITYNIYRAKDDPNFVPSASNLLVSGFSGSTYEDTAVTGAIPYYYIVRAVDQFGVTESNLVRRSAIIGPAFAGVSSVAAGAAGECKLTVNWATITPTCNTVTYSVYRSQDPKFVPSAATLIASGLTTSSYDDTAVVGGQRYFYLVRAVEASGATDGNNVKKYETPVGSLSPGTFFDDAGDTTTEQFVASPSLDPNYWTVRPNDTGNATRVYATTGLDRPKYPAMLCEGLESNTITLGQTPVLSFSSRWSIEDGWDGGFVEVSTEAGGFTNWQKLRTIVYPGVMVGPLGDPACNNPGYDEGELVFTGSGGWLEFSGPLVQYANQRIRLRFLFSSDPAAELEGWFLDDIQVSGAMIPGACLGLGTVTPNPVCQGSGDVEVTLTGSGFLATSKGQANGNNRPTTYVSPTELRMTVLASDLVAAGTVNIRVANDTLFSNTIPLSIVPDNGPPAVTPPAATVVMQSTCGPNQSGGASGATSPELAAFIGGGTATDLCGIPQRLAAQSNGTDVTNSTFFGAGQHSVSFRFRDSGGNIGTANSSVRIHLLGDLNSNDNVDSVDFNMMGNHLVGNMEPGTAPFTAPAAAADLNRDSSIDSTDFVILANYLVGNVSCLPY